MRKALIVVLGFLAITSTAYCGSETFTFGIVSTAVPSTANVRFGMMKQGLALEKSTTGDKVQVFVRYSTVNLKVTKSKTYTVTNKIGILIQGDQDIKVYRQNDLTNYMLCLSGTNCWEGIR